MQDTISHSIRQTIGVMEAMLADSGYLSTIESIAKACTSSLQAGNKILFMGNGGSAADSQHLAAELVSRFEFDRPGLAAFALTTDTSALTAIGNDYGYERLFARQIEAVGKEGDIIFGISTSGTSANVLAGLKSANDLNLVTVGMTGNHRQTLTTLVDYCIEIPSASTAKIQEGHILSGHIICGLIEKSLFSRTG